MPGLIEEMASMATDAAANETADTTPSTTTSNPTKLPKGVVLGKDGKPCRTCTSTSAWMTMMKTSSSSSSSSSSSNTTKSQSQPQPQPQSSNPTPTLIPTTQPSSSEPTDCPPDVEQLGRSSWTLLHTLSATYPTSPTPSHATKTASFLHLFSQLYPCWVCAEDFQTWIAQPGNEVEAATRSQEALGRWMCRAHNEVNRKLGKGEFDCNFWRERWRDGWGNGRCG